MIKSDLQKADQICKLASFLAEYGTTLIYGAFTLHGFALFVRPRMQPEMKVNALSFDE